MTAGSWVAGALLCIGMVLASPRAGRGDEGSARTARATERVAIPPGQEELLAEMLGRGAVLPDACTFASGQIERTLVRGTYHCAVGEVALELRHPSAAPADTLRTEKIAIVATRGAPPTALVAALQERVRQRESAFEWLRPKTEQTEASHRVPGCESLAPLPATLDPYFPCCYPLSAALLVGTAQIMVMVLGLGYGLLRLYRTARE